jgi:hypothetical protein
MNGSSPQSVHNTRIVVLALIGGLGVFLVLVVMLAGLPSAESFATPDWMWLGALLALVVPMIAAFVLAGRIFLDQTRSRFALLEPGEPEMLAAFQTYTILRAALLEGPGLFGGVVYLVSGLGYGFVLMIVSLVGLLMILPTEERFRDFREAVTRPE